ncbi:DNA polymerase I [Jeotgalibacillus proteolyticus]|uniref:DNA polymerase I n=1 Tax=Jeotgalibacillus proteolyticus TaxID=2082395 RepID=A0A2S5GFI1_9BACL|nr:DNA polymerase I [Jeotgalibacillus proteolyticus]PPA71790.1 DNA polymerase I [Jeotgalibacillus proteolyticus]
MLIDGNSIAYRAFFALPLLNNEKGVHTNAIYGFTTMLTKMIDDEKPSHILVAFDAGKTTFRHKTFSEYKGGRQKTPSELSEQFPFIRDLLNAFSIKHYELDQYEADDIIGTLSLQAEKKGYDVVVVSGDKDLTQLSSERTRVEITRKGITDMESYTPEHIMEKYGLTPDQIIDMKGLMGDSSDNIPGVPGVGEKTAIKLLKEFGTLEKLVESIEDVKGAKLKDKLNEYKDQARMSKELATITRVAPVDVSLDDLKRHEPDEEKLRTIYKELSFNSLLEKLGDGNAEEIELKDLEWESVTDITESMLSSQSELYIELFDVNYHTAAILGIGLHNESGTYFIPVEVAQNSARFKDWIEDTNSRKSVYDAKQSIIAFHRLGMELKGIDFDLLIASYVIDASQAADDFSSIAKRHGADAVQPDDAVYGKGAKKKVPEDNVLGEHISRKAAAIAKIKDRCVSELEKNEQDHLFTDLELPLAEVLAEMERKGVLVDVERLREMGDELKTKLAQIEEDIHRIAGEVFNINSPKQLGVILFEKLGLPAVKKTKTGYSTSADVLEKLQPEHEIIDHILLYRQLGKLQSTYIEGLLKVVNKDTNKIHTRYNQVLTQTGRLSSIDPNLQNIPIRLEEGRKIRQAFIPSKKDWVMFAADYSQIELRVLAHISQDEGLTEAFNNDMDIHTKTAMDVFGVEKENVTSGMRRHAKAVNFGIVYGISDYGLSQSLGITRKEAAEFIKRYLESYPKVKEYMDDIIHEAKQNGYVSTLLHRRRYIPEITSRNFNLRGFAERTAMNTPIQGTAADIIKKAMLDMAIRLEKEGIKANMLLQVHDELIFECPREEVEILEKLVPEVMEKAVELSVPLKADFSYGDTWYDAK